MIRRPPRSTLFPTRRSSDLAEDSTAEADSNFVMTGKGGLVEIQGTAEQRAFRDRKSTRLNSSHLGISYAVFCLKKKKSLFGVGHKRIRSKRPVRSIAGSRLS